MCSHKEPRKLQGLTEFPQAGKAMINCAHSLSAAAKAAGKTEERGGAGRRAVLTPLRFFTGGKFASPPYFH